MRNDSERIDWLEKQIQNSYTGISLDKIKPCEGERGGYRFMRKHFISEPESTLREAIDHAMLHESTFVK